MPGGDPDPSDSDWDSISVVSEMSSTDGRQKEGTYNSKLDWRIFLSKLTDDSTEEACWMWRAEALALIEKGYSKKVIDVEMRNSLASCSQGLWFREKHLLGHSLHQILNDIASSSSREVGIQCDALLQSFYRLSQQKGEPVGNYSMHLESAANKVQIPFPGCLGDCDAATEELLQDRFLKSVNSDIRMRIAHRIDGVPANEWPGYYKLVEFAIEKE